MERVEEVVREHWLHVLVPRLLLTVTNPTTGWKQLFHSQLVRSISNWEVCSDLSASYLELADSKAWSSMHVLACSCPYKRALPLSPPHTQIHPRTHMQIETLSCPSPPNEAKPPHVTISFIPGTVNSTSALCTTHQRNGLCTADWTLPQQPQTIPLLFFVLFHWQMLPCS